MSTRERVRPNFEAQAPIYDDLIPKLCPKYREQNDLIAGLVPFARDRELSAIDLGCGTGILASVILKAFPRARVVAYDITENMLEECRRNLSGFADRLVLRRGDFGLEDFESGYDLVVSGLSIHHLDQEGKRGLFSRVFRSMNPGGAFIIRDIVLGNSPEETETFHQLWREYMTSQGEDGDFWFQKYIEMDSPDSVEDQLSWLREAGFKEVECYWQHINFVIFGGRK